jgi:hypothetical protein
MYRVLQRTRRGHHYPLQGLQNDRYSGYLMTLFNSIRYVELIVRMSLNIVTRKRRIYKMGIGSTTGFIGSHTITHNYSVYTLLFTVAAATLL